MATGRTPTGPTLDHGRERLRQAATLLACALFGAVSVQPLALAQSIPSKNPAIRMIVVRTEAEAKEAIALYTAGVSFDQVVRERSTGPERERGGYLGRVDGASLSPAARAAIRNTRPGRLTPAFPTEGGFGVIQVLTDHEQQEEEARLARAPEALQALKQGTDLGRNGDLDGAVTLLRRAVELNPALVDGHFNLAVALARLGQLDGAITSMREVVRLQPKDVEAHTRLGTWLSSQGRHADAVVHLERAAGLNVNSQDVWLKLAQSYEAAGRPRAAVGAYRRVLGLIDRDDPALLDALLHVAMAAPDGPAAVDAARRLRPTRPGHEGLLGVGDALMLNGEIEAACAEYRMAVALAPTSARAHAGLATALAGVGQAEQAAEHLLQAIRLEPTNYAHYRALSALYERSGRLDLAIVALRDGANVAGEAQRGTQAEIADQLAALYDRADMRREAERERARAKELRSP
jgi:tetratricopeptide (TPR) repeat protein